MDTADQSTMEMAMGRGQDNAFVLFYNHPKQDQTRSKEEGRPIFVDTAYVRIMVPGDKDNIVERPVRERDKQRWKAQWTAFQENQEQTVSGTPLSQWPGITRSQVEELKHFGVHTVEALVEMADSHAQKFMGIQALKQRAQDFLDAAQGLGQMETLRQALDSKNEQIAALQEAIKDLSSSVKELQKSNKSAAGKAASAKAEETLASLEAEEDDPEDR